MNKTLIPKISFLALLFYLASCLFSPTLRAITLIVGLISCFSSVIVTKLRHCQEPKAVKINPLTKFFLFFVVGDLLRTVLYLVAHAETELISEAILQWLRTFTSAYLPWFWFAYILDTHKDSSSKIFNSLNIARFLIYSSAVLSLVIVLQAIGAVPLFHGHYGLLKQVYTTSGVLLLSFFISLTSIDFRFKKLVIVVQFIALLLLSQLAVWLGLLVAALFYVLYQPKKMIWLVAITLLAFGFLWIASLKSATVATKLHRVLAFDKLFQTRTMRCRYALWQLNYQAWSNSRILGQQESEPYLCLGKKQDQVLTHSHNIYLQKLVEAGLLGFAFWFVFYVAAGYYSYQTSLPIFLAYLAISTEGLFENWWGDTEVLTIFLFMLLMTKLIKHCKIIR